MIDDSIKRQILVDYGTGIGVSALSRKYKVARATIYTLLGNKKPKTDKLDRLPPRAAAAAKKLVELQEESNRKLAEQTVREIMKGLPADIKKASIKDKMLVLDRMAAIFHVGLDEEEQEEIRIVISSEDASGGNDENPNA